MLNLNDSSYSKLLFNTRLLQFLMKPLLRNSENKSYFCYLKGVNVNKAPLYCFEDLFFFFNVILMPSNLILKDLGVSLIYIFPHSEGIFQTMFFDQWFCVWLLLK